MGLITIIIRQKCKHEPDTEFGSNEMAPAAPGTILPRVSAKQWCAGPFMWKVVALVMGFFFITVVVLGMLVLLCDSKCSATPAIIDNPQFPSLPIGMLDYVPRNFRFVERAEWGAQPPTEPLDKLELPVPYVIISHTATKFCKTQSECTFRVRFAQVFHIESRGWSDIGYNFLVGGDGYTYVGRSWDFVGAHAYNWNKRSIGISFIGTFNAVIPPKKQLFAAQELIKLGVQAGKIAPDYVLITHRQVSKTPSPGDALYSVIQTWPHWRNISST